jgi:hypothetical protein
LDVASKIDVDAQPAVDVGPHYGVLRVRLTWSIRLPVRRKALGIDKLARSATRQNVQENGPFIRRHSRVNYATENLFNSGTSELLRVELPLFCLVKRAPQFIDCHWVVSPVVACPKTAAVAEADSMRRSETPRDSEQQHRPVVRRGHNSGLRAGHQGVNAGADQIVKRRDVGIWVKIGNPWNCPARCRL